MKKALWILLLPVLLVPFKARAADTAERYHTFIGITAGGGSNRVSYSGWVDDSQKNLDITGSYYSMGLMTCVIIRPMIGEFTLQYLSNSNDGDVDTSVSHLHLTLAAKYFYELGRYFSVTAGLGLYGDTPPANLGYEGGAGGMALLGAMINLTFDLRLMVDGIVRYGSFGLGEGSTKTSYGAALSFVYNVGRI